MTELNIKCHYQMVRNTNNEMDEVTVHEAYSTDTGLYMICPTPVYVAGESKEDIEELTSMIDTDIEKYGVVDYDDITIYFDKYIDYTCLDEVELTIEPSYEDEQHIEDDYTDSEGKILDLVQFIEKNKCK